MKKQQVFQKLEQAWTELSVRLVGKRGFVNNGIENTWLDAMLFTAVLWEYVMDVNILTKQDRVVESLTRTEILRSYFHQEGVNAFVGC